MAVDKNKIIAEATKLVQKGALDKAIAAYQRILADDPKDVRVLLKVGELHQKRRDDKAAAQAFDRVAETYSEQGFFLKAVAVYKQIVKLNPEDVRVNERLAALYQQLGLMSDAMGQYQFMAAAYEKAGDGAKLADVLKRMVELDPENIASSIKLGELYARASQTEPALECFRRGADYLKKHNRVEEWLKVSERISALTPDDLALTRELANIYLAKGDTKRALAKLQLCFKADPKHVDTLQLLAQAFRDLGQTSKTLSVYKELANVHQERGRPEDARAIWRKVQELAPDDRDAAAAIGGPQRAQAPAARAPPPGPPPGAARAARPAVPAPAPTPSAPASSAVGPGSMAKLLTETDVYVKYGLHDKALAHLERVLEIDPRSPDALERAREIHAAAGHPEDAASAGVLAIRALLEAGQQDRARSAFTRLQQIAPDYPEIAQLAAAVGATEEVSLPEEGAEEEEVVLAPGDVTDEPDLYDDSLALAAAGEEGDEVVEEEHAAATPRAALEEPSPPPPPARAPARSAPKPAAAEHVDLSDETEEADFFVQQGLFGEARQALENLLAFYPDHPALRAKLADVERRASAAAEVKEPPAPAPEPAAPDDVEAADVGADSSFDIARELADEIGSGAAEAESVDDDDFQYSVEDVFSQFKKGVEQTVKPEDTATHYDLGIAYKEMGLVDDALNEFETALRGSDRKREVDCLSMIGLCRMEKEEPKAAVEVFRRALSSDRLTKDAAKSIHYDLAAAYEAVGDKEAALYYFQKVAKADPAFRDAASRVSGLGGGAGKPPSERAGRPTPHAGTPAARTQPPPSARPQAPAASPSGATKKNIGYL